MISTIGRTVLLPLILACCWAKADFDERADNCPAAWVMVEPHQEGQRVPACSNATGCLIHGETPGEIPPLANCSDFLHTARKTLFVFFVPALMLWVSIMIYDGSLIHWAISLGTWLVVILGGWTALSMFAVLVSAVMFTRNSFNFRQDAIPILLSLHIANRVTAWTLWAGRKIIPWGGRVYLEMMEALLWFIKQVSVSGRSGGT